jgi:D-isomer specific 2-hydroxyacid dehydrogenase, catalytic domain
MGKLDDFPPGVEPQRKIGTQIASAMRHAYDHDARSADMTRIVFLDRGTMGPLKQPVRPAFGHEWVEYERTRPDEVVERLANCDVAISNKVAIRRDSLARLPRLKMIAIPATGYDAFDIDACAERGIIVCNVRGYAVNGPRTYICAHPRAAAITSRLPPGRDRGKMARGRSVLLLLPSNQ